MARKTVLFQSEERATVQFAADFLRQLADKLEAGAVVLRQGEQELSLTVPPQLVLEIKVDEEPKRGKVKQSLEVELEWYEGEAAGPISLA